MGLRLVRESSFVTSSVWTTFGPGTGSLPHRPPGSVVGVKESRLGFPLGMDFYHTPFRTFSSGHYKTSRVHSNTNHCLLGTRIYNSTVRYGDV